MMTKSGTALGPPPRKVQLRRGPLQMRRAYRLIFVLVVVVSGGWAVLDLFRWSELTRDQSLLTAGFAIAALLAFMIWRFVESPYAREMRLGRIGYVSQAQITSIGAPGRHGVVTILYTFRTVAGAIVEGRCALPRRFPITSLEPGQPIEVLYDPARPQLNKPRLALQYVDIAT